MATESLEKARFNMVQQQIRPWEVFDQRVLDILDTLPREKFVPEKYRNLAYADTEVPIDAGQHMLFPRIEARLMQALAIQPDDIILEIGTGTGFLTACLAKLGTRVVSLDIRPEFIEQAAKRLEDNGIDNVELRVADGLATSEQAGPFDVIAVSGSLPEVPEVLLQQLRVGGRLFVVSGNSPAMEASLITRVGEDSWRTESLFETDLAPLDNAPEPEQFKF
ncbi:MAG: protein-L-isoaspartate O-methyltransferase [Gammaproteobacteria bacterium]|nr:protein-L-isoaspartate O-methyltransferase [Gammaproteobacteria bacterium]